MRWKCMSKALFSTDNGQTSRLSIFYCFSSHKNFIPKYLDNSLTDSLKLHEHRGGYSRKKLPLTILKENFRVPRNTAPSKIGNSVISLLWQLRCHCNPDHNKISIFIWYNFGGDFSQSLLWRRSLCSNLGGIDPEKLYRATLTRSSRGSTKSFSSVNVESVGERWLKMSMRAKFLN